MNSCYKQWKSDQRKNADKKKKLPSRVLKKKNQKATKKPKVVSNLSTKPIANTINPTTNCTCPAAYTLFVFGTNIQCLKFDTKGPLSSVDCTTCK